MTIEGPDQLVGVVLAPALEVLSAWSIAHTDSDPAVFHQALDRVLADAAAASDPLRGLAETMFGLSCLSGILLDELAVLTDRSRGQVLHDIALRYLGPSARPPQPR